MQITTQNVRTIFRQSGEKLSGYCGPRILKNWIHDNSFTCTWCDGVFSDDDGGSRDSGRDWYCYDCAHHSDLCAA